MERLRSIAVEPIQLDGAVDQLEPVGVTSLHRQGQLLPSFGLRPPEVNRAIDRHGSLVWVWTQQRSPVLVNLDVALLVGRLKSLVEGCNPDLQKAAGLLALVHLAVHDSGAGAHALHLPGSQHFCVAHGVLVVDLTVHHHRDDFHVAVRVHPKAFTGGDGVVVDHQQRPEACPGRIEVVGEREGVAGIQPAQAAVEALSRGADQEFGLAHDSASGWRWSRRFTTSSMLSSLAGLLKLLRS